MNTNVNATTAKPLRCAVYARVSVADDQESKLTLIEAQAEACRAYIKSQQSHGWVMVEPAYTDDGASCGRDFIFQTSCLCSLSRPPTNFRLQTTPA
jgi:hypothetical protein